MRVVVRAGSTRREKRQNEKIRGGKNSNVLYRSGHFPVVKLLLESGADINAVDVENWTALHYWYEAREGRQGKGEKGGEIVGEEILPQTKRS